MKMSRDELEYAISQYIDGTLPMLERDTLEVRLATDAEAREILAEYRKLDAVLKTALPTPAIAWDRLSDQINRATAQEEAPIRHYSIGRALGSMSWAGRVAIAASLLFAISLVTYFINDHGQAGNPGLARNGVIAVTGPQIERAPADAVVAQIAIGPAPETPHEWFASEDVVTRPTVVLIDRANTSGQDSDSSLLQ
jgi:anti-sigma factor RsiW